MRSVARASLLFVLGISAQRANAQVSSVPARAVAFGWSPAAGLFGVEGVARSFAAAPRLGGAVGVGLAGFGVRLNLALRQAKAHRSVPYVAVGHAVTPWIPVIALTSVTSVEGGVQVWPIGERRLYMDFGAGVGYQRGKYNEVGPVLRLLFGRTF
jgi:hypothetical protein